MSSLSSAFSALHLREQIASVANADTCADVSTALLPALREMDLLASGENPRITLMPSSPWSRLFRVDLTLGPTFLKQATAPAERMLASSAHCERTSFEVQWLRQAHEIVPECTPQVYGECANVATFAMAYLPHSTWDQVLRQGEVNRSVAAELAHLLARLHAASAHSTACADRFADDQLFRTLALDPLFSRTARAHQDCTQRLRELLTDTLHSHVALIHGALLPENILVGPRGPVLVDADCAHYGDPMFDLSRCVADLLLRLAADATRRAEYIACCDSLCRGYFSRVTWEMPEHAERRAAALIPALLLAGVDGRAPVDFLVAGTCSDEIRATARRFLLEPTARLDTLFEAWLARFNVQ